MKRASIVCLAILLVLGIFSFPKSQSHAQDGGRVQGRVFLNFTITNQSQCDNLVEVQLSGLAPNERYFGIVVQNSSYCMSGDGVNPDGSVNQREEDFFFFSGVGNDRGIRNEGFSLTSGSYTITVHPQNNMADQTVQPIEVSLSGVGFSCDSNQSSSLELGALVYINPILEGVPMYFLPFESVSGGINEIRTQPFAQNFYLRVINGPVCDRGRIMWKLSGDYPGSNVKRVGWVYEYSINGIANLINTNQPLNVPARLNVLQNSNTAMAYTNINDLTFRNFPDIQEYTDTLLNFAFNHGGRPVVGRDAGGYWIQIQWDNGLKYWVCRGYVDDNLDRIPVPITSFTSHDCWAG